LFLFAFKQIPDNELVDFENSQRIFKFFLLIRTVFLNLFAHAAHFASIKVWRHTKNSKILKITSKNSCFTLNKLKLAKSVQSNYASPSSNKIKLMHTGLTVFLNIGSKISKSNRKKFGGTLCRSSWHTG